jgi:hypothetical protein
VSPLGRLILPIIDIDLAFRDGKSGISGQLQQEIVPIAIG